jgi:hypothetical protein
VRNPARPSAETAAAGADRGHRRRGGPGARLPALHLLHHLAARPQRPRPRGTAPRLDAAQPSPPPRCGTI